MAWAREAVGLNQSDLARLIGSDASTVNKFEKGDRVPSVFHVIAMCAHLRISADYLIRGLLAPRFDQELSYLLAAQHPELVIPPSNMDLGRGMDPEYGTPD